MKREAQLTTVPTETASAPKAHKSIRRMPVGFGPQPGPRQRPGGGRWASATRGRALSLRVTIAIDATAASRLLPEGMTPDGETATITMTELRDLPWLAGRGYNLAMVTVPVVYRRGESVEGDFELVTWESLADPIISGREELGFNKVYADVANIELSDDGHEAASSASWDGFAFLRLTATGLAPPLTDQPAQRRPLLHHRYLPEAGRWGDAAVDCVTGGGGRRRTWYTSRIDRSASGPSRSTQGPSTNCRPSAT